MKSPTIYKIVSPTNKVYIGQTIHLKKRLKGHEFGTNGRIRSIIHSSIKKYGIKSHQTFILHELPIDVSQDVLNNYEEFYVEQYKSCGFSMMNIRGAGSRGKHSEETRRRMSLAQMGNKNNLGNKRPPMSDEWKRKIGDANKGKKIHSEEHKLALSKRMIGNANTKGKDVIARRKSISQYSRNGEFIKHWVGVNLAADTLKICRTSVTNCLTGVSKTAGGFIWKYNKKK